MHAGQARTAVILLVEDDAGDQELTRRALSDDMANVDLRIVSSGIEAMEYLQHTGRYADANTAPPPDLILLDLNMPMVDGREVLRRIRNDPALRHLVVIVLTTSNLHRDVLQSYSLQCNAYITKPVSMAQFIPAIRELRHFWFELATLPQGH